MNKYEMSARADYCLAWQVWEVTEKTTGNI